MPTSFGAPPQNNNYGQPGQPGGIPNPAYGAASYNGYQQSLGDSARENNQKDFNQNLGDFSTFMSKFFPGGLTTTTTSAGPAAGSGSTNTSPANGAPITQVPGMGTVGTWTPSIPAAPTMPAPQSSSAQAFATAKDQVGSSLSGLMKALNDNFASRGIGSSATAGNTAAETLLSGEGQLGDVARAQATADTNTANKFAEDQYNGSLTARGQDIGAMEAAANEALTGRGQDVTQRGQDLTSDQQAAQLELEREQAAYNQKIGNIGAIGGLWNAFMKNGGSGTGLY